eukprot:TRINITY_DN4838_c0_g1_i1.p1 TRINITY_DN4838_c0_g1~~TRINITY_DN4838_c0_g1_i1.p1  ORF type:complete len:202 (+),score=5.76 TRINITY_DN4838_c0_g1_i1:2-607(+)
MDSLQALREAAKIRDAPKEWLMASNGMRFMQTVIPFCCTELDDCERDSDCREVASPLRACDLSGCAPVDYRAKREVMQSRLREDVFVQSVEMKGRQLRRQLFLETKLASADATHKRGATYGEFSQGVAVKRLCLDTDAPQSRSPPQNVVWRFGQTEDNGAVELEEEVGENSCISSDNFYGTDELENECSETFGTWNDWCDR